jgi:hypothetical protein
MRFTFLGVLELSKIEGLKIILREKDGTKRHMGMCVPRVDEVK